VSEFGRENWSTANAWSIEIKIITGENKNGRTTKVKNNFCLSVMLFFCVKNLGSSLTC
jgi:hypothetical protein